MDSFDGSGNILPGEWRRIIQLTKGPVLFVAYPLQEAPDIAIMLWAERGLESIC